MTFRYKHSGGASPNLSWEGRRDTALYLPGPDDYPKIQRNNIGLGEFRLNLNKSYYLLLSHIYKVRRDLNEVSDLILSIPVYV